MIEEKVGVIINKGGELELIRGGRRIKMRCPFAQYTHKHVSTELSREGDQIVDVISIRQRYCADHCPFFPKIKFKPDTGEFVLVFGCKEKLIPVSAKSFADFRKTEYLFHVNGRTDGYEKREFEKAMNSQFEYFDLLNCEEEQAIQEKRQ